ncbi:MAG: hypothetical protein J0H54_06930, partial [Rhizobiales bacterium]|nr:hypothetical protein [Hyphomicrobiales bacterium]
GVYRVIMSEAVSTDIRLGHNLFNWPYLPPDRWIAGGQTKAGASALQWFSEAAGGPEPVGIDRLLAEAAEVGPGSDGVVFLPYLMGRGSPRSDIAQTGTFTGMRLSTRRGALARAVVEGVAFALREIQEDFAGFGHPPQPIRLSGGGGRSPLWRQILADMLGQPLTYHASDSTLGSAMLAAVGLASSTRRSAASATSRWRGTPDLTSRSVAGFAGKVQADRLDRGAPCASPPTRRPLR